MMVRSTRARLRYAFGDAGHEFGDARVLSVSLRRRLDLPTRFYDKVMAGARVDLHDWRNAHLEAVALVRHGLAGFDRTASRLGLEARDPWGDCRVVDFFLSLPLNLKVEAGRTKYLVRKACEPFLPPQVPWRIDKEHVGWKLTKCVMDVERPNLIKFLTANREVLHLDLNLDVVFERANRFVATGNLMDMDFCYNVLTLVRWRKLFPQSMAEPVA
jgi:asparagine synthetase B (glutamine-hydrolysing)